MRAGPAEREQVLSLRRALGPAAPPGAHPLEEWPALLASLLRHHRPEAAAQLIDAAEQHGPVELPWQVADQVGGVYMHLGRPADARLIWEAARGCPSPAMRHCRLGCTFWVERDFAAAIRQFEEVRAEDESPAEACWALAMLHAQLGQAESALGACRRGLQLRLNERQRSDLEALQDLLGPYRQPP
jgi:hypothetical protein